MKTLFTFPTFHLLKLISFIILICLIIYSEEANKKPIKLSKPEKPSSSPNKLQNLVSVRKERFKRYGTTSLLRQQTKKWLEWEIENEKKLQNGEGGQQGTEGEEGDNGKPHKDTNKNNLVKKAIFYKNKDFKALCEDPVFDSVETNLDATEVVIIKGDKFFIMERLKFGSGELVASGKASDLFPGFESKGFGEMTTVKEGRMRGHNYAYYSDNSVMVWKPAGWVNIQHNIAYKKTKINALPKNGFMAALHRRDVEHPFLIGLNGKKVYYYKMVGTNFTLFNVTTHDKSAERFPPDLTAATSQPNGFVYLFRGREYCVREMFYKSDDPDKYCDLWRNNTRFLGCYGTYKPPTSVVNHIMRQDDPNGDEVPEDEDPDERSAYQIEFCDYNYIADLTLQLDGIVYIFKEDSWYYTVFQFPEDVQFTGSDSALDKWNSFHEDPDAFMVVQEGPLRGHAFEFKKDVYYHWTVDGHLKEDGTEISQIGETMERIDAIVDNSDIIEPMAIGFSENNVHYLDLNGTSIKLIKTVKYSETKENWPKGITAALFINPEKVYIVRKGLYCKRPWNCSDKETNCVSYLTRIEPIVLMLDNHQCKKWLDSKILFGCVDNEKDEDHSLRAPSA